MLYSHAMDLSPYRDIRERDLRREGYFLAEGRLVVERLLATDWPLHSILCLPRLGDRYRSLAENRCSVYCLEQGEMEQWAGFPFHRGVLAAGFRRPFPNTEALLTELREPRLVVVCVDLVDAENLGAILRSGSVLGADAAVLSSKCADVLGRRVIRTSMGSVFHLPVAVMRDDVAEAKTLVDSGLSLIGATLDPGATPLSSLDCRERLAIVLGNEGEGLPRDWLGHCRQKVRIPMRDADASLNVAVAAGIILYAARVAGSVSDR